MWVRGTNRHREERYKKELHRMIGELSKKEFKVLGLGEVMLRLSPVGKERISGESS